MTVDRLVLVFSRLRSLPDPGEHRPLLELIDERIDDMTPASALFKPRRTYDDPPEAA